MNRASLAFAFSFFGIATAFGQSASQQQFSLSSIAQVSGGLPTLAAGGVSNLYLDTNGRLQIIQASVTGPVAPGAAASQSLLGGCVYRSSAITLTTGQQAAFGCDAAGNLNVNVQVGGGTGGGGSGGVASGTYNSTAPTLTNGQTASLQLDSAGNLKIAGTFSATGGTASNGSDGVATSSTSTNSNSVGFVVNSAGTLDRQRSGPTLGSTLVAQSDVNGTASGSTAAAAFAQIDTTGYSTISFTPSSIGTGGVIYIQAVTPPPGTTCAAATGYANVSSGVLQNSVPGSAAGTFVIQTANVGLEMSIAYRCVQLYLNSITSGTATVNWQMKVAPRAPSGMQVYQATTPWASVINGQATTGGIALSNYLASSAATVNQTAVKTSVGRLYKVVACNTTTTPYRIKFYNALTANVTVGTTTPLVRRIIPASGTAGVAACASYDWADVGFSFSTAITYAITQAATDSDATAPAAGAITDISVEYQ